MPTSTYMPHGPENEPATTPVFLFGYGRSGTNWLLNSFDQHPETHCRNEPNQAPSGGFLALPHADVGFDAPADFGDRWDAAVEHSATHMGFRDRTPQTRKRHFYKRPFDLGLWRPLERRRLRMLLSALDPRLRRTEYPVPWFLGSSPALEHARPILKINDHPSWCAWLLSARPTSQVIHLVRHPGGVLHSWRSRYLPHHPRHVVHRQTLERLRRIARDSESWARRMGDLDRLSTEEAELWSWRFSTETTLAAGRGRPNFRFVVYEDLVRDPVGNLRKLFDFADLAWSPQVEARLDPDAAPNDASAWYQRVPVDAAAASRWRDRVSAEDVTAIERVLEGSPLARHWR